MLVDFPSMDQADGCRESRNSKSAFGDDGLRNAKKINMLRNQGFRIHASDQKCFFRFLDLGERIFADFRDFGDLEPGRRALERSEAGRQAPGRILIDFQWIFFSPGSKSHGFFLAGDENLLIL